MRQGFAEHFQNLNLTPAKIENRGPVEPEDMYHERVRIQDRLKEQI